MFVCKIHKIFFSKILEMAEKIKTDVNRLLMVSKMKKSSISQNILTNFCLWSIPKVVYLRPFLSSLPFSKFWKNFFMYCAHKHVETGPNSSHEIPNFLKYHMHRDITDRGDKPAWNLSARARERVIWRIRPPLSNAVRVDTDRKNLPSSLSFALTEFADWRCHFQSGLWLVSSICNISMITCP